MSWKTSTEPMVERFDHVLWIHASAKQTEFVKTVWLKFQGHGCASPALQEFAAPSPDHKPGRRKEDLKKESCEVSNAHYPLDLLQIQEQFDRAAMRRRLLTPRQLEVASLVAEGINNKEIAPRLGIGEEGVKKHITAAMRKANVDRRTKLTLWFLGL